MRRVVDVLAVVTLVGMAVAIFYAQKDRYAHREAVEQATQAVRMFDLKIKYHAATEGAELTARGWPVTIDPDWFEGSVPRNALVSGNRPWLEIAPPEDAEMEHPRLRMTVNPSLASFWYNPYNGALRARVPVTTSDQGALEMYNRVNRTNLSSIFDLTPRPAHEAADEAPADDAPEDPKQSSPDTASVPDGG